MRWESVPCKRESLSQGPSSLRETVETPWPNASEPELEQNNTVTNEKPGRTHNMIGDRMAGNGVGTSSELPHRNRSGVHAPNGAEEPAGGSQSVRSSAEAGNDRGAKGRRKVEA